MATTPKDAAWWAENEGTLRDLAAQGRSAREIAVVLGLTRNAVLGKAHRLGVKLTPAPSPPPRKPASGPRSHAAKFPPVLAALPRPVPLLEARDDQCRFGVDPRERHTADMLVCGAAVIEGLSWCPGCAQKVFNNPPIAIARMKGMPR